MRRGVHICLRLAVLVCLATGAGSVAHAQRDEELVAKRRVFDAVGPGLRVARRDAAGNYYVLTAPGSVVMEFDAQGRQLREVPSLAGVAPKDGAARGAIVFGADLDVDADGRIYVADRGANLVLVFARDGTLALKIPVAGPASLAALGEGEIAVASSKPNRLVTVYDLAGKVVREFGDPADLAERVDLNRFLNTGRLGGDPHGHLYYSFTYLPEPTVRKYDRHGYAALEIELDTLETQPEAQAVRREIARQDKRGGPPTFKPVVNALGVDPETEDVWMAIADELLHFDRDGTLRATYRVYTPESARLEPTTILIEHDRLLLGADPAGIYEFARPGKPEAK